MRFCRQCTPVFSKASELRCKNCWHAGGDICISCRTQKGQSNLDKYRHCRPCLRKFFCLDCMAPPPADLVVQNCRVCSSLAVWCPQHCSVSELQSRLCRDHLHSHGLQCQFCGVGASAADNESLQWWPCMTPDCQHEVYVCRERTRGSQHCGFLCSQCWSQSDRQCVSCKQEPAQTQLRFVRRCRPCFARDFSSREDAIIQEESRVYLQELSQRQEWDGTEPALQLLLLPLRSPSDQPQSQSLPEYVEEPHFLSPLHCRLCLQPYEAGEEEEHLRQCGQCTKAEYRKRVLRRVLAEWPQRIPAQVLRTRLAAFKGAVRPQLSATAVRCLLPLEAAVQAVESDLSFCCF